MTAQHLPRSTPSAQGVDAGGITAFLAALAADDIELHSLMLVRHGAVIAEGWWEPYGPGRPHLLYSLSKSVTSAALGLAVAEGLVSLDDPVVHHFPELDEQITDQRSRRILVRHVAAMASGHRADVLLPALAIDPANPVRGFLLLPPDAEPGTVFAYNQPCSYTVAAIVAKASGQSLTDYLRPRLFDPLGFGPVGWQRDAGGQALGFTGLHARTEDIARLGMLHLGHGAWRDAQILPSEWVDQATGALIDSPGEPEPDWRRGYGFQFWRSRYGYRGDGAYGQFCLVLPDHDAVLAITAATERMQSVLNAVWQHVLPAMGADADNGGGGGGDNGKDEVLAGRLAGLRLPLVPGARPEPDSQAVTSWDGYVGSTDGSAPLAAVAVRAVTDGWQLTLTGPTAHDVPFRTGPVAPVPLAMTLGTGEWTVSEIAVPSGTLPVAVNGGWTDARTLTADVVFLETPHRLRLSCDLPTATVTSDWHTAPLHPVPLHELHSPPG